MPATFLLATKRQPVPAAFTGRWIYFGENWADMRRWEKSLPRATRISYAAMLGPAFLRLKPAFVRWISELGRQCNHSLGWWMTALASKNVWWTPFFLQVCYLEILAQLRATCAEDSLIVCDDWPLLRAVEDNLSAAGFRIERAPGWRVVWLHDLLLWTLQFIYRWFMALRVSFTLLVAARRTQSRARHDTPDPQRKQALIHTCIDDACFGENGQFVDRYFGSLADWLEQQGYQVTVLPWLFNISRTPLDAYRWLRDNRRRFFLPEDYVTPGDPLRCSRQILSAARLFRGEYAIQQISVTHLVRRERREALARAGLIKFLLYGPALSQWISRGNRCDLFIDMFENHSPERAQIKALRACSPATRIIGYQHGAASPPEFLHYSITADEWAGGIFPDRIVCSGSAMARKLRDSGFPPDAVAVGPAMRYTHILARQTAACVPANAPSDVLAIFPLEASATAEMFEALLTVAAWLEEHELTLRLRSHPMMTRETLLRVAGQARLPVHWCWADATLQHELQGAAVVVAMGTNAQVDAAASGVPVVCLARELGFAYNHLDDWSTEYPVCRAVMPAELKHRLAEILGDGDFAQTARLADLSAAIRAGLGPVDEQHLSAFL